MFAGLRRGTATSGTSRSGPHRTRSHLAPPAPQSRSDLTWRTSATGVGRRHGFPRPPRTRSGSGSGCEEIATPHQALLLALFIYVEGAGRHADTLMTRVVQKWELDSAQMSVLFALWCTPPPHRQSPTVLHRQLIQSPSGISHTLRRLTAAGLTRRIRDPHDGRSWHVELTPSGVEVARSATDELVSTLTGVFDGLTAAQVDRLADAQRTIIEVLASSDLAHPASSRRSPRAHCCWRVQALTLAVALDGRAGVRDRNQGPVIDERAQGVASVDGQQLAGHP